MTNKEQLIINSAEVKPGTVCWRSPSNIALVKYWGKYGNQIPRNPSISFTLSEAFTETRLNYAPKIGVDEGIDIRYLFEGQRNEMFEQKIKQYFEKMAPFFPFIHQFSFEAHSKNSFPHSAGIASSASSMSAMALCLCSLEDRLFETLSEDAKFRRKASEIARLGSGSASRSVYENAALWGKSIYVENSANEYAIDISETLHPIFKHYQDTILIVSADEKIVSSTDGHALMDGNLYAETRYHQANKHIRRMMDCLTQGDLEEFVLLCEQEALTLHALMMSSYPSYILMESNTLNIIKEVKSFRASTKIPVCFTLDAGPNVHLLYPDKDKIAVFDFIENNLKQYCLEGKYIMDFMGIGPVEI